MNQQSAPLTDQQEHAWRLLSRVANRLPRALDAELQKACGLSLTEYILLTRLSEAPGHVMRMAELAEATMLSASRITRLTDQMQADGMLDKARYSADARGSTATLTDHGLARLKDAQLVHLQGARLHLIDHIGPAELPALIKVLTLVNGTLPS